MIYFYGGPFSKTTILDSREHWNTLRLKFALSIFWQITRHTYLLTLYSKKITRVVPSEFSKNPKPFVSYVVTESVSDERIYIHFPLLRVWPVCVTCLPLESVGSGISPEGSQLEFLAPWSQSLPAYVVRPVLTLHDNRHNRPHTSAFCSHEMSYSSLIESVMSSSRLQLSMNSHLRFYSFLFEFYYLSVALAAFFRLWLLHWAHDWHVETTASVSE